MKIFVGFGYNDRDKWIKDLVFPIIRAFGDEVATGEEAHGGTLSEHVKDEIRSSDALIGFLTLRGDGMGKLTKSTHWWVLQELSIAEERELLVLPVREQGLEPQTGITGNYQWIDFRPEERDKCLVEIAKALGRWHLRNVVQIELLPESCTTEIRPLLRRPGFKASYQILDESSGEEGVLLNAQVVPKAPGGLYLYARDIRRDALLRVQIEAMGQRWISEYKAMDTVGVHLAKE
jgi:hypothetical protein